VPRASRKRAAAGTSGRLTLEDLNEEIIWTVISFLPGKNVAPAEAALPEAWRASLAKPAWWQSRCDLEYFRGHRVPRAPCGLADTWREKYRQLASAQGATAGTWCYRSRSHGLGDRVAAPQMFVGPGGQKLFNYGGWYRMLGPQTDLRWVSLGTVCAAAAVEPREEAECSSSPARSSSGGMPTDEDSEASPKEGQWRFKAAQTSGRTASPGGVQTLTPCWFRGQGPSAEFVEATARELGDPDGGVGASLILVYGGAQNYRNESSDWAVGVLHEGEGETCAKVIWGQPRAKSLGLEDAVKSPTRRAAHTATYIPARLAGRGQFPEGCIVVFGGHTDDCSRSLSSIDILDLATWRWHVNFGITNVGPMLEHNKRHGHSATLLEVDRKGYLLFIGGGRGNIMGGGRSFQHEDKSDVILLDLTSWSWIGQMNLGRPVGAAAPGRHHTACVGLMDQILIFGGGEQPCSRVLVLQGQHCVRRILDSQRAMELREVIVLSKKMPRGRKMHAAASLLPWASFFVVFGGWDISAHFHDLWVCALGACPADLQQFTRPFGRWQSENNWQSEATDFTDFDEDDEDDEDDDGSDFDVEEPMPVRFMSRDGQIRIVRMMPADLAQMARGAMLQPQPVSHSRNDVNLMNALALAHPAISYMNNRQR